MYLKNNRRSMSPIYQRFLVLILLLACTTGELSAQKRMVDWLKASGSHPGWDRVDADEREGRWTREQALEQKLRMALAPATVDARYAGLESEYAIKCISPLLWEAEQLKVPTEAIIEAGKITESQQNQEFTLLSNGKWFEISYFLEGEHAISEVDDDKNGIPDYAEITAHYADSSYRHMVFNLGFSAAFPKKNMPIRINLRKLPEGVYGYVNPFDSANTIMFLQSNYNQPLFIRNDDENKPIGALKVTLAHELRHVLQSVVIRSFHPAFSWIEMDATLMEELVFDNVNDYYTYLKHSNSIFSQPGKTLIPGSYFHVSWALYFIEKFGTEFWKKVWQDLANPPTSPDMIGAITRVLASYNTSVEEHLTRNIVWHFASASEHRPSYGFSESASYPLIKRDSILSDLSRSIQISVPSTPNYAARVYELDLRTYSFSTSDTLQFTFRDDQPSLEFSPGFLAYYKDGTVQEFMPKRINDAEIAIRPPFQFSKIEKMAIVMVNTSGSARSGVMKLSTSMAVTLESERPELPDRTVIFPNYPNPFNPTTTIPFRLASSGNVRLEVLDLLGRRVALLADTYYNAGPHQIVFDAGNLSTGVYFTRLITPEGTFTQKMSLIK